MLRSAGIGLVLLAAPLFAGGFWLQMGTAEANPEAKAQHATLVVRATGCHNPEYAKVSGVMIQKREGRMESFPLKLIPLKEPGTYAVRQQWPDDSAVTLKFVGHNDGATTSMLVRAQGSSVEKGTAKFFPHEPTAEEEMTLAVR